jgi:hypothetical protein
MFCLSSPVASTCVGGKRSDDSVVAFALARSLNVSFSMTKHTKMKHFRYSIFFYDWLTMHHSITLVNFQLDAQNSYLFIYIIHLLKSSTCFEHYPAHLQEFYVMIVYMQPLVSSLCKK